MTIVFISPFTSQPDSMNSAANQSSNSRCAGYSACTPKSSAVLTNPIPKIDCQKRFTVTLAVNG